MRRYHAPYPQEFKRQIVELARSERTPEELAREFESSADAIRTWVAQEVPSVPYVTSRSR